MNSRDKLKAAIARRAMQGRYAFTAENQLRRGQKVQVDVVRGAGLKPSSYKGLSKKPFGKKGSK